MSSMGGSGVKGLTKGAKFRIALGFVSTALALSGLWLLFPALGWRGIAGITLCLWGNNIAMALQQKRDRKRFELDKRLLRVAEGLTK